MKKLLLILLCLPMIGFGQDYGHTFGSNESQSGYSVQQTTDGGYIIAGSSGTFGNDVTSGSSGAYLIKTDSYLDTLWTRNYGDLHPDTVSYSNANSVKQTSDGGYIVSGMFGFFDTLAPSRLLIKTDSYGDTLWTQRYYSSNYIFSDASTSFSVQQTTDGGYVMSASASLPVSFCNPNGSPCPTYSAIIKTDSFGDTLWTKVFNFCASTGNNEHSVQQTIDGGYILLGHKGIPYYDSGPEVPCLIKTNSSGDTLWTKTFGNGTYTDGGSSVQQTNDGGYIFTGRKSDDVWLIKTDGNGIEQWSQTFGDNLTDKGYSVQQTTDGGYIITGSKGQLVTGPNFNWSQEDVWLIKTDGNGIEQWSQTFGDNLTDKGYSVQQTTDGGYIITGSKGQWSPNFWLGNPYDVYLIKTDSLGNSESGCSDPLACNYDSLVIYDNGNCNYPTTSITDTVIDCESYIWNNTTYIISGIYNYLTTNAAGCDSTATLNLTINNATTSMSSVTACDTYTWNGTNYIMSGNYDYITTNAAGCDSTATLNLTINNATTSMSSVTACDTYTWNGTNYIMSGNYDYITTNAAGCDSTATLNLTINNAVTSMSSVTACDTYTWDGNTYFTSASYTNTYSNTAGCDSIHTLNLMINNSTSSTDTHIACDEFMWYCDGNTYTSSNNTATYTYTNAAGCDSVVTLDLTINNSTSNSTTATACDSYTWAADGNTYTTSGTYTDITTNAGGCDHTETLELTINYSPNTTNILGVTNVEFLQIETYSVGQNLNSIFSWHLNNGGIIVNGINTNSVEVQWGSIDGSYDLYVVETTQDGCSDTALIVVNANCLPNASSSTITACDSYSWEGETYTTSGTYTNTYINTSGCDSVHTLDLTIYSLVSSISQSGEVLSAVTTPIGLSADWYNIQTDNGETRIWLMVEDAPTFNPTFDCSYFIVVNDNGCIDTSETYSYGANAARIGSFVTSPNPTTALINVKFDNSKNQFVMFELVSNNGIKLDEFITIEDNLDIDLSKYASGSYYLYFNSEDAVPGCRLEEVQKVSTKIILNK